MDLSTQNSLIEILHTRFTQQPNRHAELSWPQVLARLQAAPAKLEVLAAMEASGGEPDLLALDANSGELWFCDFSAESPLGRRSLCFDRKALDARKANKPAGCVDEMAQAIGIELLNEQQYRLLQSIKAVDQKTSSWLATPTAIRKLGGALFGDRRYDQVFVYHNGADSYYAARGFRGVVRV